ncbi:hypothetical protein IWQ62_006304, partial [Dispira parvispora]
MQYQLLLACLFLVGSGYGLNINIMSPWSKTVWKTGQVANLTYDAFQEESDRGTPVLVELQVGRNPNKATVEAVIHRDLPLNTKSITWQVPYNLTGSEDYFIRMNSSSGMFYSTFFTIVKVPHPMVEVMAHLATSLTHNPPKPQSTTSNNEPLVRPYISPEPDQGGSSDQTSK